MDIIIATPLLRVLPDTSYNGLLGSQESLLAHTINLDKVARAPALVLFNGINLTTLARAIKYQLPTEVDFSGKIDVLLLFLLKGKRSTIFQKGEKCWTPVCLTYLFSFFFLYFISYIEISYYVPIVACSYTSHLCKSQSLTF